MSRTPIELDSNRLRLDEMDLDAELKHPDRYEKRLAKLQLEMLHIQQAYFHAKKRAILVFEGADAAGKGGAIRRITEPMDPRSFQVYPIAAPSAEEQGKHYMFRFWERLPALGHLAIFDRSWYGRVLVERVEGFATSKQWARAYEEINEFERLLVDDGAEIVKLYLHIDKDQQKRRFIKRIKDPYKHWKLTEEDIRNRDKWDDYVAAAEEMFDKTSTTVAPWHLIPGNSKRYARIACLETIIEALGARVDMNLPTVDKEGLQRAAKQLGVDLDDELNVIKKKAKS